MELLFSNSWLRQRIEQDPDLECEAGFPLALLASMGMFISPNFFQANNDNKVVLDLKMAFGTLIKQLRRRDKLSYTALADKAQILEEELRSIEHDAHYVPRPRTVHNLAKLFGLPMREMMKLSGATVEVNSSLHDAALRFAAKSDDLSTLSNDERRVLNEFIKYLNDQEDENKRK